MALPKKGTRLIAVDHEPYRWTVRRKPTYSQGIGQAPLTVAVEHGEQSGSLLVIRFPQAHSGNWLGLPATGVTPANVALAIREARAQGWQPEISASPFRLDLTQTSRPTPGTQTDDSPDTA